MKEIKQYFIDTIKELKKCTWPSINQLVKTTIIVLLIIIFLSFFIAIIDFLSQKIIKLLIKI